MVYVFSFDIINMSLITLLSLLLEIKTQVPVLIVLHYKLNLNIRISRSTHDFMFDPNVKPYHQVGMYSSIGTTLRSTMFYLIPPITHLKCIYVGTT